MIRLTIPDIGVAEIEAAVAVLRSGQLVQGERVRAFEDVIAAYTGARHAVAVSSGTAALHIALLALEIKPGDRVAVPCFSWPATANAVVLAGAEPVFVDIDPKTYNIDPLELERAFAADPAIKAVMPVHAFGGMANMPAILDLAARFGVLVIEDAACAIGAELAGRSAGTWGNLGCFSFHPRKIVTTGEGGAIVTNDDELQGRLRSLRNHGIDTSSPTIDFVTAGFNYRLTEFQAALGIPQMGRLRDTIAARRAQARVYADLLAGTEITVPTSLEPAAHTFQSYVVLLPRSVGDRRGAVLQHLRGMGVEATIGTYHIPVTTYFRLRFAMSPEDFPIADDVWRRAVSLPLHGQLDEAAQRYVVQAFLSALRAVEAGV